MINKNRVFQKDISGVAAVEFALIAPVLIFILIGIVDFGMYINMALKVENVTRAAAEYLLAGGDEADLENDIILPSNLGSTAGEVIPVVEYSCECVNGAAVACGGTCVAVGDYVRRFLDVSMEINYETVIPYPGLVDNLTLQGNVRLQANQ